MAARDARSTRDRRTPCRCRAARRRISRLRPAASSSGITGCQRPSARSRGAAGHQRMAQQALRREHDERQRVGQQQHRLPAQQMEILRGGRAVGDAQIDVGGRLEEPLDARARVIRPLALVAVRQQQHERRRQSPLGAARRDELVDDHLRAVDEIAVLRFPDHQPRRAPGCCSRTRSRSSRTRSAGCCRSRTPRAPAAAAAAARRDRR